MVACGCVLLVPSLIRVALLLAMRAGGDQVRWSTERSQLRRQNRRILPAGSAGDSVLDLPCALEVTWPCCLPSACGPQYLE
jgi:hypothetical protein